MTLNRRCDVVADVLHRGPTGHEAMSVLETVTRVKRAEEEADALIERALREEREAVHAALEERKRIIDEARQAAAVETERRREAGRAESGAETRRLEKAAEAEKEELAARASRNGDEAAAFALDLFLRFLERGRD